MQLTLNDKNGSGSDQNARIRIRPKYFCVLPEDQILEELDNFDINPKEANDKEDEKED